MTKLEPCFLSEAEKTPLELETSTPAAIVGEVVAAYGSGGTIGWAGAEDITHVYWTGTQWGRHLLLLLGKVRMKPKSTLSAYPRLGVTLFSKRGERKMKILQPQRLLLTHISRPKGIDSKSLAVLPQITNAYELIRHQFLVAQPRDG